MLLLDYIVLMVCYCCTTVFMVCKMLLLDYRVLMVCYCCSMQFSRCVTAGLYSLPFHGVPLLDYIVLMANHQLTTSFSRCVTASLYGTHSLSLLRMRSKHIKGSKEGYLLGQNATHSMLINSILLNLLSVWIFLF